MKHFVLTLVAAFCLLLGCTSKEGKKKVIVESQPKPFIFNMNQLFTDAENSISFPVWFNDSIIRTNQIYKISREIVHTSIIEDDSKVESPFEKRDYFFNKAGYLDSMIVRYFYDEEFIGEVQVLFASAPDQHGYASTQQWVKLNDSRSVTDITLDPLFKRHVKIKQSKKAITYMEVGSKNHLYCMLQKKYWGPLSVDSIVHPSKSDLIVLGSIRKPVKKYGVLKTVHEQNVQKYTYFPKSNTPKTIYKDEFPFAIERTYVYTKSGLCNGFVDSTFSKKNFLAAIKTSFDLDANKRPITVTKTRENKDKKTIVIGQEKFQYFTYD